MPRSYLYVPGDQPRRIESALALAGSAAPGALILDLEDAVAEAAKDTARARVADILRSGRCSGATVVRVNAGARRDDDITAVVAAGARTVCLPKSTADDVAAVAGLLTSLDVSGEHDPDSDAGPVRLIALVESAVGMRDLDELAAHPIVATLAIGEADLCSELGIRPGNETALWPLRMRVVAAAAAGGCAPPTGPVSTDFRDLTAFAESCAALRDAGFGARSAIHPAQVPVIEEVFGPSPAALAAARELVERYDEALRAGVGVILDDRGRMVDEAVVRAARRLLDDA